MAKELHINLAAPVTGPDPFGNKVDIHKGTSVTLEDGTVGTVIECMSNATIALDDIKDIFLASDDLAEVGAVVIEIIKTASVSSGSVAVASTVLGIASTSINAGDTAAAAAASGAVIAVWALGRVDSLSISGGTITLTFTSRVGFKVRVSIHGKAA